MADLLLTPATPVAMIAQRVASTGTLASVSLARELSRAELEALARKHAESPSVREHAVFAELELSLREGDASSFAELARRYCDHETLGYAVRHRLATHPRTPVEVLRELSRYDDETGQRARARLADPQ